MSTQATDKLYDESVKSATRRFPEYGGKDYA